MRSSEEETQEKVKKNVLFEWKQDLQDKETKAIESVEPCLNWQLSVSPDEY